MAILQVNDSFHTLMNPRDQTTGVLFRHQFASQVTLEKKRAYIMTVLCDLTSDPGFALIIFQQWPQAHSMEP